MPAVIFSGNDVKTLKSNIDINSNAKVLTGDSDDPTSVAKDAPIGSLYIKSDDGVHYRKLDAGSSTNWEVVGSGGAAGINYQLERHYFQMT